MADEEHLKILQQGVEVWNEWRRKYPELIPDLSEANLGKADLRKANLLKGDLRKAHLSEANLSGANLSEALLSRADLGFADLSFTDLREAFLSEAFLLADLSGADLSSADLCGANLREADLSGAHLCEARLFSADLRKANLLKADLRKAHLSEANLSGANLSEAKLSEAILFDVNLSGANLREADLSGASLRGSQLIGTDLCGASLLGCMVYGVSVWDVKVNVLTNQKNLLITDSLGPIDLFGLVITVDNIKIAQFIYLLLTNKEIRDVIDTITSKAVLILGNFSEERKAVLDAIRVELRKHNYLPIMFDFPPLANQTLTETVTTLARMARFVIADLTDARTVLQELEAIVPELPSLAVRLIIKKSAHKYGMLDKIRKYPWVIKETYEYDNADAVIASIQENVIRPAEAKVKEMRQK